MLHFYHNPCFECSKHFESIQGKILRAINWTKFTEKQSNFNEWKKEREGKSEQFGISDTYWQQRNRQKSCSCPRSTVPGYEGSARESASLTKARGRWTSGTSAFENGNRLASRLCTRGEPSTSARRTTWTSPAFPANHNEIRPFWNFLPPILQEKNELSVYVRPNLAGRNSYTIPLTKMNVKNEKYWTVRRSKTS
jgi:hypothetical protein